MRGNWHKESESSNSLLQKCCHDVDLICHWMSPQRCAKVSSFGRLSHFRRSDKVADVDFGGPICLFQLLLDSICYKQREIFVIFVFHVLLIIDIFLFVFVCMFCRLGSFILLTRTSGEIGETKN